MVSKQAGGWCQAGGAVVSSRQGGGVKQAGGDVKTGRVDAKHIHQAGQRKQGLVHKERAGSKRWAADSWHSRQAGLAWFRLWAGKV